MAPHIDCVIIAACKNARRGKMHNSKEHNVYCVDLQLIIDMHSTDPIFMVKFIIELRWRVTLNYLYLNHCFLRKDGTHMHT